MATPAPPTMPTPAPTNGGTGNGSTTNGGSTPTNGSGNGSAPDPVASWTMRTEAYSLESGGSVKIHWPSSIKLTAAEFSNLQAWFQIVISNISDAAQVPPASQPPAPTPVPPAPVTPAPAPTAGSGTSGTTTGS
jgi:hypothetical protein